MHMQVRCLCTGARFYASTSQLGRIVNKVMSSGQTKKGKKKGLSYTSPTHGLPSSFIKPKQTHQSNKRVTILNKVFMKYITDLMATGEVASSLVGRGIEITHVKVAPDFSAVNVYWIAQNDADYNKNTETVLKLSAGKLQHELTQLHVIGIVPPINFVKNKQYNVIRDVEERLSKVDFGDDFEPSTYIVSHQKVPVLKTAIPEKVKQQLLQLNETIKKDEDEEVYEIPLPEMRQDVMGIDHKYIMTKVKTSMSKAKTAQSKAADISEIPTAKQTTVDEVSSFLSSKENEVFEEFLKKRASEEKLKKRALPYWEAKLEEEMAWEQALKSEANDLPVSDDYRDEYEDTQRYK